MFKKVISWLLILSIVASLWVADGYVECNCDDDDDAYWNINTLLFVQRGSDLCIAVAYFSIPIEIIYFVSCSKYFPFKWVLFEFGAFIIFCGLSHFLTFFNHSGQQTFHVLVALLVSKILTALISLCTAISLLTLFPLLLKFKTREYMLLLKNRDLDQEVGKIKQKEEMGMHVRMLTQEIRKSLDRHTILYTTLVELSKILNLQNCVIWMPNENRTEMRLTHDPTTRENFSSMYTKPISTSDPDVKEINGSDGVKILDACSPLAAASSRESFESESVAAIRIPMLKVSNFRGGTPEIVSQCYAILVLVQPGGRFWRSQEIEIVRAAADQVAVALSHAAVVEESQHMSERLMEQNRALTKAREDALRASQASNAFQTVMSNRLGRPLHSILGLLSLLQDEKLRDERQQLLVDSTVKTSNVLSTLIGDVIVSSTKDKMRFPLDVMHFQLHLFIREAACVTKCLCTFKGYNITIEVDRYLPNHVMGDDKRFFHVLVRIVGNLLNGTNGGRHHLTFRVLPASENDVSWKTRRSNSSRDNVYIKFEFCTSISRSQSKTNLCSPTYSSAEEVDQESFSFAVCRKLVQLMQGEIFVVRNSEGFDQRVVVIVGFQRLPSIPEGISEYGKSSDTKYSLLHGVRVLLADHDDLNRAVTRKMLEKLGCIVTVVSFGFECIGAICPDASALQIILMDLHLPDVDGFEVTMRLGKHQSQNRPLIIGLAAATADEDVCRKCLQIGMSGIIHKPVLLPGLADELQKVLLRASRVMPR